MATYEERLADRLAELERRIEAFISQDQTGSTAIGAGRIPFGGSTGVLTDDANLFWDNTNDRLGIGTSSPNTRVDIRGTNNSYPSGPTIDFTTAVDIYPELQILPFTHDNINITFDGKFDGTNWKSSDLGSNFQIRKGNNALTMYYSSGVTAGNNITVWSEGLSLLTDGFVRFGGVNVRVSANLISLANNAVGALGMSNSGFAFIHAGGTPALFAINGAAHTTVEIFDTSGVFSITAGTAASTNVYWSAGNSRYEIENKRGATVAHRIWLLDAP